MFLLIIDGEPVTLYVPINSAGLRGNITFHQETPLSQVAITIHLSSLPATLSLPQQQYEWSINSFPVFYDSKSACSANELGKVEHDLFRRHGPILIPPNDANNMQTFMDSEITLQGSSSKSIWHKSVLLKNTDSSGDQRACSNILASGQVKTAIATFTSSQIAGTVLFRENEHGETMIFSNLFNTGEDYKSASKHEWKILVTDILDTKRDRKCDYLQIMFDPSNTDERECSINNHASCKMGELTKKHGMVIIGSNNNRYSKQVMIDTILQLSDVSSERGLYLVLYDKNNANKVLMCAKITEIPERVVKAIINMDGVKGSILFIQSYRTDPIVVTINFEIFTDFDKLDILINLIF